MLLIRKLWAYLADLDKQVQERPDRIVEQMNVTEGVTDELKANDQLEVLSFVVENERTNIWQLQAERIAVAEYCKALISSA